MKNDEWKKAMIQTRSSWIKIIAYEQGVPQSHTAGQTSPKARRGRAKEHQQSQDTRKTIKVSQPTLSSTLRWWQN